jgi:hypothetical protein
MRLPLVVIVLVLLKTSIYSQYKVSGVVRSTAQLPINKVQVFDEYGTLLAQTGALGRFNFTTTKKNCLLFFM